MSASFRLNTLWVRPDLSVTPQIRVNAFESLGSSHGANLVPALIIEFR